MPEICNTTKLQKFMGWKGNLKTGIAIARQIERSEKRRANNAAKQYKSMLKQEAFENGQKAIQE